MVNSVRNGGVAAQPQDVSIAGFEFGLVLVRLDMPVGHGVRVVRIRRMHMLRRESGGGQHPGRKRENQGETSD